MPDTEYDQPPQRRQTGFEGHEPESYDPAQLMREIAGGDAVDLPPRSAGSGPPSMSSYEEAGERPEWHRAVTPGPVAASWLAVEEAIAAAVAAERAERALDGEQEQAQRTESARVRSAVASGKTVKATAPGRDWSAEKRHSGAVAAGHRERCRRLRSEYDALVEQRRPDWAATIVAQLPDAKAETLAALTEAGLMVTQLLAAAEAAQAMLLEPGGSVVNLPTLPIRQCAAAMQALAQEVEASVQLGGEALVRSPMTPPYRDREQIGAALLHGAVSSATYWLAELELREKYALTSWTRGIPLGTRPSETAQW